MGGKYAYRCIRNLGINLDDPDTEPTALIPQVTQAESDGTYIIDATNLSEKSRRLSFQAGSLPTHDDESPYNRPYARFRVSPSNADYCGDYATPGLKAERYGFTWQHWNTWNWYQNKTLPDGYRLPNLRELLIMQTRLPGTAWTTYTDYWDGWINRGERSSKAMYMSYTSFSRRNISELNKNGGFRFNAENSSIGATESGNDGGYVRGVKDLQ